RHWAYRPSGDHLGEARDVVLCIPGAHAERMQLEDLAPEILVQPGLVDQAGDRLRSDRAEIVEVNEHRRMPLDRLQHVAKTAEHMRADRLALVAAGPEGYDVGG